MLAGAAVAVTQPRTAAQWQALAKRDLEQAHAVIVAAHPGVIDSENPGFKVWLEGGYRQALSLVPRVVDYESMLSVVRYYTTGFRDNHLHYSDDTRSNGYPIDVDGWRIADEDGKYAVVQTLSHWPVPLPPVGSEFTGCDGRSAGAIIRQVAAPFVTRRTDDAAQAAQAGALWIRHLAGYELHHCHFRDQSGSNLDLPVTYRRLNTGQVLESTNRLSQADVPHNSYARLGDVLWVRTVNFWLEPGTSQARDLDLMLKGLSRQARIKTIVFDVRGNRGGDSDVGQRIFDAATGGLVFDRADLARLPKTYAQWRVSDELAADAKEYVARELELYGKDSPQAATATQFLDSVVAAKAAGKTWFDEEDGYRLTREEIAKRHGRLRRFSGKIAIVTDDNCRSACLDFADLVHQVPGSIQLGETTGSDSVYIDIGRVTLPSGNHMILPLKVWRNRLRANDEAYTPDIPLHVNMKDDAAVQAAVIEALATYKAGS
jgi:hypothetical protein